MAVVRALGLILLSVYLFFSGLFMLTDMSMPEFGGALLGLVGMGAGVLIIISLGKGGR